MDWINGSTRALHFPIPVLVLVLDGQTAKAPGIPCSLRTDRMIQ